jgi:hypothetical protein
MDFSRAFLSSGSQDGAALPVPESAALANAIASQAEDRLNLCVPGAKETARMLKTLLGEDVSLGLAPDMLFELISDITGGMSRAKAKALAKGEDPDGDAATLDVLAAIKKFTRLRPDPVEALEPLQPRLYSIASSHKAGPGRTMCATRSAGVSGLCLDISRHGFAARRQSQGLHPARP